MVKLLIIDDDVETADYLKEFFELRKCTVLTSSTGEQGLKLAKDQDPNVVLLDIKMDGMDGLEVLKRIKAFNKDIKVIMITVASDQMTRQKANELGADDFIKKPLNIHYLEGTVSDKISNLSKKEGNNGKSKNINS